MHRLFPSLILGLLVLLAACDSDSNPMGPPAAPNVTGTWVGEVIAGGVPLQVEMDLVEEDTEVGGTGTIDVAQDSTLSYMVSGSHVQRIVSLNLFFTRPPLGRLSGDLIPDRDVIDGTMSGPGFMGDVELTLRRVQTPIVAP